MENLKTKAIVDLPKTRVGRLNELWNAIAVQRNNKPDANITAFTVVTKHKQKHNFGPLL